MNKKHYALYLQLEKELDKSAIEVYKWYSNNIEKLYDIEIYIIEFSCIENNLLFFKGREYLGEWCDISETLPLELLFFNDVERKEYSDKYHQDKAEKFKADRQEAQEQLQLARQLARTERYETYLELKEEFEDGEK